MLQKIFLDDKLKTFIQTELPCFFEEAEQNNSRNGKLGMQIGSERETILIAMKKCIFGDENVDANIGITESEVDVIAYNEEISIKTFTGKNLKAFKLYWASDYDKMLDFYEIYFPNHDMIYVHINWNSTGGLYYAPKESQQAIFNEIGKETYLTIPRRGTNSRGVSISTKAVKMLSVHNDVLCIPITWNKQNIKADPYAKYLTKWKKRSRQYGII